MDPIISMSQLGSISVEILTALAPLLKNIPSKTPSGASPAGKWHGKWIVQQPERHRPKKVEDTVNLKIRRKGKIAGVGDNPYYGRFTLSGIDTTYAIAVTYSGEGTRINDPGVCLLIKAPDGTRMDGVWWQFGPKAPLVGGTVTMTRKS